MKAFARALLGFAALSWSEGLALSIHNRFEIARGELRMSDTMRVMGRAG